jgi:hypothetical protein
MTVPLPPALVINPRNTTVVADMGWLVSCGVQLSLVCYFAWLLKWRWQAPIRLIPMAEYAIRWHLTSIVDLLIILSFAYLLVGAAAMPLRSAANDAVDRFMALDRSLPHRTTPPQAAMLQMEKKPQAKQ